MVDQQLVETSTTTSDGVSKIASYMEQTLFCVVCSVTETSLTLLPLEINVKLDSPTSSKFLSTCFDLLTILLKRRVFALQSLLARVFPYSASNKAIRPCLATSLVSPRQSVDVLK